MTTTATEPEVRDHRVYVRPTPADREIVYPGLATAAEAKARALALSVHNPPAKRPFYMAVYDGENAYPVAVYQNGEELSGAALEQALTTPHGRRAEGATATCRHCEEQVTMLGGSWAGPDGCTNCMINIAADYAPHEV
jgi:hypothetical protein